MLNRTSIFAASALFSLNSFALELTSSAIQNLKPISSKFVCEMNHGDNLSPELSWTDVPEKTKSLLLVLHDPDAKIPGGYVHWIVYISDPSITKLKPGLKDTEKDDFVFGKNDNHDNTYHGPCAPQGTGEHHYHFNLYALDFTLDKKALKTMNPKDLLRKIQGHSIGESAIVGLYSHP